MLLKAVGAFFILVYIHITFSQTPATCLDHIKNEWPRDGILRVEILRNSQGIKQTKENQIEDTDISILRSNNKEGLVSIDPSATLPHEQSEPNNPYLISNSNEHFESTNIIEHDSSTRLLQLHENASIAFSTEYIHNDSIDGPLVKTRLYNGHNNLEDETLLLPYNSDEDLMTVYKNQTIDSRLNKNKEKIFHNNNKKNLPEVEKTSNTVWSDDQYVVEYSLEYGFLRLSAATRQKLNIPVHIVTLDPHTDKCFGDTFSRFILHEFLGYDDLLMASVKVLAEQEDNKGYLRYILKPFSILTKMIAIFFFE